MSVPHVLILPSRGESLVTHHPDCKFAAGCARRHPHAPPYVDVPASIIAPGVGRCGFCGGGR